jgi:hypothetical protein
MQPGPFIGFATEISSMVRLKFAGMHDAHSALVGPAEAFLVAGNFMYAQPGEKPVAQYIRHQWRVQDQYFSRYDALDPCTLHFTNAQDDASERFGPFRDLFAADGTMYAGGELFAKFAEETLLWHSFKLETYWPNLIIASAPEAAAR